MNHRRHRRCAVQATVADRSLPRALELAALTLGLLSLLFWSFWPPLVSLFKDWRADEDYSVGQLVPLVAAVLVWHDWKTLRQCSLKPCAWGGMLLLLLAAAGGLYGLLFMFESAQRYSMVVATAGLVLAVAGWAVFRRVSWILLFLFLMVPLPGRVHNLIGGPLQRMATWGSLFLLEVAGMRVSQQGNTLTLNNTIPVAVAEACSGLRMLIAFVIAAALIAYLVKRPRWQKAVLLVSSIPVAVICNVIRIFITALLMLYIGSEAGQKFFHDIGGFVMITVAVSLLFGEIRLMDRLIVSESSPEPQQVIVSARPTAQGPAKSARTKP
jgi:exosortase